MATLEQYLDQGYELPEAPEQRERFRIDSESKADWALRKLTNIRKEQAANDALATEQIDRIMSWVQDVNGKLEDEAKHFEAMLQTYHNDRLANDPNAKTIKLPHGVLKARKRPGKWSVDDDAFLAWAKEHRPDFVRVKEEPNRVELRKTAAVVGSTAIDPDTGEQIPGVSVEPDHIHYSVEVQVDE